MHQIINILQPNSTIFDIGAHIGDVSVPYVQNNYSVIMVEPQHTHCFYLQQKFGSNPNVKIINKGVADKPGMLQMNINSQAPYLSTFSTRWMTGRFKDSIWDQQITVEVTTLDQLIADYGDPAYVKIDVEGFEYQILLGLSKKTGIISFEFTVEFFDDATKCLDKLIDLGYTRFNYSIADQENFQLNDWHNRDQLISDLQELFKNSGGMWGDIYAA